MDLQDILPQAGRKKLSMKKLLRILGVDSIEGLKQKAKAENLDLHDLLFDAVIKHQQDKK